MKFAENGSLQENAASLRDEPRKCVQLMAKSRTLSTTPTAVEFSIAISNRETFCFNDRGEPLVSDFVWQAAGREQRSYKVADYVRNRRFYCPEQAGDAAVDVTPAADVYRSRRSSV